MSEEIDWQAVISEIGLSIRALTTRVNSMDVDVSRGTIWNLATGQQRGASYEVGRALIEIWREVRGGDDETMHQA